MLKGFRNAILPPHTHSNRFLALYLALFRQRVQSHPAVLAEALLGFLDTDRNGKIDGGELKVRAVQLIKQPTAD